MKKKIVGSIAVVAIAVAVAFNVNMNMSKNNSISLLGLVNVEALAQSEGGGITCNRYCEGTAQCWNFKWGWNNLSYICYYTGYQFNHCVCQL